MMQRFKKILEQEIGSFSCESYEYALNEFNKNTENTGGNRVLTRGEILDELSTYIQYFYYYVAPKNNRKMFIFREVTRVGGNLEKAYLISRENIKRIPSKEATNGDYLS